MSEEASFKELVDLLRSPAELAKVYSRRHEIEDPSKYSCKVKLGQDQWLYMIAPGHTYDPEHPGLVFVEQWVEEFLERTKENRIVLLEGGKIPDIYPSKQETVQKQAETGHALYCMKGENYLIESPEPSEYEEMVHMLESHNLNDVLAYYLVRQHEQWMRGDNKQNIDFERYIMSYFDRYIKLIPDNYGRKGYTYDEVIDLMRVGTNSTFDLGDRVPSNLFSDPSNNPVAATSVRLRDESLLKRIIYTKRLGLSILIVFGTAHAITLEPAIRSLGLKE